MWRICVQRKIGKNIYKLMNRLFKYLILVIVLVAAGAATYVSYEIFGAVNVPAAARQFEIKEGQTVKQIINELVGKNIIKSPFWFRTYVWLRRAENRFIAGDFVLPARLNALELFNILTQIKPRPVKSVKILEGWGIPEIVPYFENQNIGLPAGYQAVSLGDYLGLKGVGVGYFDYSQDFPWLAPKIKTNGLEGYLFPDTYEIYTDATIADTKKMLSNFERKVTPELRAEIERQGKDFYDVLIMASIIEAEVPHEADRPIVADIFWSRLLHNVALQSDATLKYIIGGKRPALTAEELKMDSPYNTYKYKGLPLGPIDNPGLDAIKAAIYPTPSAYLYYLSDKEGITHYAKRRKD